MGKGVRKMKFKEFMEKRMKEFNKIVDMIIEVFNMDLPEEKWYEFMKLLREVNPQ